MLTRAASRPDHGTCGLAAAGGLGRASWRRLGGGGGVDARTGDTAGGREVGDKSDARGAGGIDAGAAAGTGAALAGGVAVAVAGDEGLPGMMEARTCFGGGWLRGRAGAGVRERTLGRVGSMLVSGG